MTDESQQLQIEPLGKSQPSAYIPDYLWLREEVASGLWHASDGTPGHIRCWREIRDGQTTRLVNMFPGVPGQSARSDCLKFILTSEGDTPGPPWSELHEWDAKGVLRGIIPVTLELGQSVVARQEPKLVVRLLHAGPVLLRSRGESEEIEAACVGVTGADGERCQWLLKGIGEAALGIYQGPLERWLVAWSGGDRHLFGGFERALPTP